MFLDSTFRIYRQVGCGHQGEGKGKEEEKGRKRKGRMRKGRKEKGRKEKGRMGKRKKEERKNEKHGETLYDILNHTWLTVAYLLDFNSALKTGTSPL